MGVFRFIAFSLLGVFLFFVPVTWNGVTSIPVDHLITLLQRSIPLFGPLFTLAVVLIGGVTPWLEGSYRRDTMSFVMAVFRTLGVPIVVVAFLHHLEIATVGPEKLMLPTMLPFLFSRVVMPVSLIVPIGAVFLTFIVGYGLLEFVGVLVKPIMRPVYHAPGRAAVNAVAAFVGSFSVAIFFTDKMYLAKEYTTREAVIIMTGFSTVSTTFMIVIANTAGMMEIWNFYFWSTLIITFLVTAITLRMPPISRIEDVYPGGEGAPEPTGRGNVFRNAVRDGLEAASSSKSLGPAVVENLAGGIRMILVLAPSIASFGLLAFVLVHLTPLFDIVGMLFAPFTLLLGAFGFPEPVMTAKAAAVVLGEMFVPNLLVASFPIEVRYVTGVVSVSAILFFSGSIPCILASNVRLGLPSMLLIWFERTALSLLIAGSAALAVF